MSNLRTEKYNKVFINYAKEDIEVASSLYEYLASLNYAPWLDKICLLPGQNWDYEIRKALKEADFIILLLSNTSVVKRGYVQREYKLALQYCEEKLESDIYVIPCKIDDCEAPEKFSKFQWHELYKQNENKFLSIEKSLSLQRQKYINIDFKKSLVNKSLDYSVYEINEIVSEVSPQTQVEISYFQFLDTDNINMKILNSYIKNIVFPVLSDFRFMSSKSILNNSNISNETEREVFFEMDNEISMSYNFNILTNDLICFDFSRDCYVSGAAHGYRYIQCYNFIVSPFHEITIKDLFDNNSEVLPDLHRICYELLIDEAIEREIIENRSESILLSDELYSLDWETFSNFYLSKDSVTIVFNPYEITAYAFGHFFCTIKFDDILALHPSLVILRKVKQILEIV